MIFRRWLQGWTVSGMEDAGVYALSHRYSLLHLLVRTNNLAKLAAAACCLGWRSTCWPPRQRPRHAQHETFNGVALHSAATARPRVAPSSVIKSGGILPHGAIVPRRLSSSSSSSRPVICSEVRRSAMAADTSVHDFTVKVRPATLTTLVPLLNAQDINGDWFGRCVMFASVVRRMRAAKTCTWAATRGRSSSSSMSRLGGMHT